jgi:uncharacterized protein (TIGR03083 family)
VTVLTPDQQIAWFRREADAFRRVLEDGDLDAPVAACPGWTLTDLTRHLGSIHRWAREGILTGPGPDEHAMPTGRDGILAWFAEGANALHETLLASEPDTPCWTFAPPEVAGFWMRRQAHETSVHRWDAESSQGTPGALDATLALDGVHEVVDMFFPRQVRLGRIPPLARSLRLTPAEGEPRILAGDGTAAASPGADVDAEIAGPAEPLVLLLWGRTVVDDPRLRLRGSRAAAEEVLGAGITP